MITKLSGLDVSRYAPEVLTVGTVVISVDAELGWGFHDLDPSAKADRIAAGRRGWRQLLSLFDDYQVPATWAVVGHLFLDDCDGFHEGHPTPDGWFMRDREWRSRPDLRLGGDLVSDLLSSSVDHDVGCHTFSHVICSNAWVTAEVLRAELAASAAAARPHDVTFRSFVYPRNAVTYPEVLAEFDYTSYRGPAPRNPTGLRRPVGKLLDTAFPRRIPLVHPTVDENGLVNLPASLFLFGLQGWTRATLSPVFGDPVVRQVMGATDRAARRDGVLHLWLHPNNLLDERDVARVRDILAYVRRQADETDLTVRTMRDVANEVLAEHRTRLAVEN